MQDIVEKALIFWGVPNANFTLIAARENSVFRIDEGQNSFALRLHRKGYRTDAELRSELQWMERVSADGIAVPTPIPSSSGAVLVTIDGVQIDALSWLSGEPFIDAFPSLGLNERIGVFEKIGSEMARLHAVSDAWPLPQDFERCAWDREGLLGETPLWGRFWDNPYLDPNERALLLRFRVTARDVLRRYEPSLDYGLIHADLVGTNVMIEGNKTSFIDFDDGGFGFRLFDLATALLKFMDDPDFPAFKSALIEGYLAKRFIDLTHFDLFLALRAMTYVGWNIARMNEENGRNRNQRFIKAATTLAQRYLNSGTKSSQL